MPKKPMVDEFVGRIPQISKCKQEDLVDIDKAMRELWPRMAEQYLKPEAMRVWAALFRDYPPEWCRMALREYFEEAQHDNQKRFFPKIGDIRAKLMAMSRKNFASEGIRDGTPVTAKENREKLAQSKGEQAERNEEALSGLTEEDFERHKLSLLAQDWRLRWLAPVPAMNCPAWRGMIANRVRNGLEPGDEDPDRQVPPRPHAAVRMKMRRYDPEKETVDPFGGILAIEN